MSKATHPLIGQYLGYVYVLVCPPPAFLAATLAWSAVLGVQHAHDNSLLRRGLFRAWPCRQFGGWGEGKRKRAGNVPSAPSFIHLPHLPHLPHPLGASAEERAHDTARTALQGGTTREEAGFLKIQQPVIEHT